MENLYKSVKKIISKIFDLISSVYYDIKRFFRNIYNLIRWFPIIWKDRDWDDTFIFEILKFKLKNTSKYLKKRNFFVGVDRECEYINTCVKLIERIQNEYYESEYYEFYDIDFKFIPIENSDCSTMETKVTRDDLYQYFLKYPKLYDKILSDKIPEFIVKNKEDNHIIAMQMGRYRQKKCEHLLFKILEERIRRWWD